MLRRARWIGALAGVFVALGAVPAFAGGAGTETFTEHAHEVTFMEATQPNPCTGEIGTLRVVAKNFVFHLTTQADGDAWATGTGNGEVTFTPLEAGGVSYRGHFTQWFGDSFNNKNQVEHSTMTFVLKGTDGSSIHQHARSHFSTNAKGEVKVEIEVMEPPRCG